MEEKVRLSDIASELGLSTAAVSYVLHGKTGMVSERTAIRVRQALEERGYLPRAAEVLLAENPAKIRPTSWRTPLSPPHSTLSARRRPDAGCR